MTTKNTNLAIFCDFLKWIEPFAPAYQRPRVYFVARRQGSSFEILKCRIFLFDHDDSSQPQSMRSENFVAGYFYLEGHYFRDFVLNLLNGKADFDGLDATIEISAADEPIFSKFHPEGLAAQNRLSVLSFVGKSLDAFISPSVDWELKAARPPYDGLADLFGDFRLGPPSANSYVLEIVAGQTGAVDYNSSVADGIAQPCVRIDSRLDRTQCELSVRIIEGTRIIRKTLPSSDFLWTSTDKLHLGSVKVESPPAALLNCTLIYRGQAVHTAWLKDPSQTQNSHRTVLESIDPSLNVLSALLSGDTAKERGSNSRDLERGIAWLAWLLGFAPLNVGSDRKLSDAVDVVAYSPTGHYAVIECTTALLKADNKLTNLAGRAERIRAALTGAGNHFSKVVPIIVSTRPRDELKADFEAATALGITVITREDIENAFALRSLFAPNAEALLSEAARDRL
ncbi:hypothetical protein [Aliihoeflea sp. 40Bstr573]|uniref:hypothetical protein n=1 Tax=Aliihoeflea sp. 40Bstr573 TaxID=2696467 RepID=UPI0020945B50|nr:hypothetical protein [Aliihoeflea sp. 40Bstr573]MCO6389297.1 hypothetical protein [Aliihoeflea sp. 40Bstr573]